MTFTRRPAGRLGVRTVMVGALLPTLFGVGASSVSAVGPSDAAAAASTTVDVRVTTWGDDAEETASGSMRLKDQELEMTTSPRDGAQKIGLRFRNVQIPAGATVTSARLEFEAKEKTTEPTTLTVRAEAAANSDPFRQKTRDLSRRNLTTASANWSVEAWTKVGATYQSVDLSPVVQEVVSQQGWDSGNALTVLIEGSGRRVATSFSRNTKDVAPRLIVEYSSGATTGPDPEANLTGPVGYGQTEDLVMLNGPDWSGLTYQPQSSSPELDGMWFVNDESMLGVSREMAYYGAEGSSVRTWEITDANGRGIDAEGIAVGGYGAAFVVAEARGKKNSGQPNAVYEYSVDSETGKTPELRNTWTFGYVGDKNPFPKRDNLVVGNKGIEGVAFIPDYELSSVKFDGVRFTGSGSFYNGVVALGYESDPNVYLVALDPATTTSGSKWRWIATVPTSLPGVAALEWDGNELWAYCGSECTKSADHFSLIAKTVDGGFGEVKTFQTVKGAEGKPLEGFAIEPRNYCDQGTRTGWWTNDGKPLRSMSENTFGRCPSS